MGAGRFDHKDGNGLNNTRSNLRPCTQGQNNMNQRKRKNATSRFKGVTWSAADEKWKACITANHVQHHLGYFCDEEEAARAYDKAARSLHGEFARLNFPEA
jgi:hypothetical protein